MSGLLSSSSSDELSFILDEFETHMLEYFLDDETEIGKIELLMKLRQARQEKRTSSSS